MSCKLCFEKLSFAHVDKIGRACASCRRHYLQMQAGFKGVRPEPKDETELWDNSSVYESWANSLSAENERVQLDTKEEYVQQRCDTRDMRAVVGLPEFAPLESQVYTAWIEEGVKDGKIQEVLGLNYDQLSHVKRVIRVKLQKQMAYFKTVKRLEDQAEDLKKRKGL
jgi:hypothetical protein